MLFADPHIIQKENCRTLPHGCDSCGGDEARDGTAIADMVEQRWYDFEQQTHIMHIMLLSFIQPSRKARSPCAENLAANPDEK